MVPADAKPGIAVQGKGMIQGLDVAEGEKASAITSECFDRGLLIGPCGTGGRVLKHLINTTVDNSVNPF